MSEEEITTPEENEEPDLSLEGLGLELTDEERADAEAMVAHLREQFAIEDGPVAVDPDQVPDPDGEPEEPEPVAEVPTPASPPPAPVSTPDVVLIDGREVPVAEARSLIDLRNYLAANPDKAAAVRQAIEGQPEPPPVVEPPEWIDRDDPAQMGMWERQVALEKQLNAIGQNQAQQAAHGERARATADANAGISTFRTLHPELTEDDITTLRTHAVSLDIIDGLSRSRSGPDAVLKALDIAYWDHPEFRARASAVPTPSETKATKAAERKGKLNGLAGTSGSAPRVEAKVTPSSDREMRDAAAKWLQEQNLL